MARVRLNGLESRGNANECIRGATMVDYINTTPKLLINKQLSSNSEYESNNLILLLYHYYYCYYQEIKVS